MIICNFFPLAYFLLENCGSEPPVSINPLWYEVETWISNSPCKMKLTGDLSTWSSHFVLERFLVRKLHIFHVMEVMVSYMSPFVEGYHWGLISISYLTSRGERVYSPPTLLEPHMQQQLYARRLNELKWFCNNSISRLNKNYILVNFITSVDLSYVEKINLEQNLNWQ